MGRVRYPADEIVKDYLGGMALAQIRAKYNVPQDSTIYGILRRRGIAANRRGVNREHRTKYDHAQVIADYLAGVPLKEIARKHNMPFLATIAPILAKHGIEATGRPSGALPLSMKPWDAEYFTRHTPEVAYWAGFLMADGSLGREGTNGWRLSLTQQERDIDHLRSFCDAIGLDRQFIKPSRARYRDKVYSLYRVEVYHPTLGAVMRPWGIVPDKTHNYAEPNVPDELLPDYLRGWLDGDGSIAVRKWTVAMMIVGNHEALNWYASALRRLGYDGGLSMKHKDGKCYARLYVTGRLQVRRIAELLHATSLPRLDRKWAKLSEKG